MAHFVAYIVEKRNRQVQMDVHGSSVDIGTRSSCALTVRDNVAAERHCEILFDASRDGYFVRDLGSSTGTYVNGVRVTQSTPIKEGDGIVLGTLRLSVFMGHEDDASALALEVHERGFQFQKSALVRTTGDWIRGDREEWKESEVSFGRFPALRVAVWSALLLGLLAPFVLLNEDVRATSLSPGPLTFSHAALFDGTANLLPHQVERVQRKCGACHESGNGIPLDNCLACHESSGFGHPFPALRDESKSATSSQSANLCIGCHVEHRGDGQRTLQDVPLTGEWSGMLVSLPARTPGFVPETDDALCARCHEDLAFDDQKLEALLASYAEQRPAGRMLKVAFDGFNHEQHLGTGLSCKNCHVPDLDGQNIAGGRDFQVLTFEGCMACHGAEDLPASMLAELPLSDASVDAPTFPVQWHGATDPGSSCASCHEQTYNGTLRSVQRDAITYLNASGKEIPRAAGDPKQLFGYSLRSHREQFAAAIANLSVPANHPQDDCRTCHQDGTWLSAGEKREGRFYHGLHLFEGDLKLEREVENLAATEQGLADLGRASQACEECHSGVSQSDSLATPFYRAEQDACVTCHQTEEGDDSAVPRLIEAASRIQRTPGPSQVAFPHSAHADLSHPKLAAGCYACHQFRKATEDFRNPVITPEAVQNCTACHDSTHSNVGGGACGTCHAPGDPVFGASFASDEWSLRKEWPAATSFSHFSSGHLSEVQTNCQVCHEDTHAATSIMDVKIPVETNASCRKCHVEDRGRFHWR